MSKEKLITRDKLASCLLYFNEKDEVLAVKRKGGRYGFPGGKVHNNIGESHEEALVREVKEETNIDISVDNIFPVFASYVDEFYCVTFMVNTKIDESTLKQMEKDIVPKFTDFENFIKFSEFMNYNIGALTSFKELMKKF